MSYNNSVSPIWLRQVATALSSRYNVKIREGKGWAMDIHKRELIYKAEHLLALDRDTCLGILLHELGHLHFTASDWTEQSKLFKQYPKITHNAVNAYEDVRINEKMSQSYMGSRDLIVAMNELLAGDGVADLVKMNQEIKERGRNRSNYDMPEWFEIFYVSMCKLLGDKLFPQWTPDMYYDEKKMTIINEIVREAEQKKLAHFKSTQDIYDFVEQVVFPKIGDYLPTPEPSSQQGDGSGMQKGGDEASEGSEGSENSDASDSQSEQPEPAKGDSDDKSDDKDDEQSSDGNGDGGGEEQKDKPQDKEEKKGRGGSGAGGAQWQKELEQKVKSAIKRGRLNPDEQFKTEPFNKYGEEQRKQSITHSCNVATHLETSTTLQRQFKNKFEVIFRNNQYARERVQQRAGRINNRVLYKHRLGKDRLFKKKIEISKKSYAVSFGLDLSGSMSPSQVEGSFHAMLAFMKTLELFKIPHSAGFFSHESAVGKPFNKTMVVDHMSRQASSVNNGGTRPDELIKTMFGQELAQQKVKEKIAIILTDGIWRHHGYEQLEKLKRDNPSMHIYVVPLMLHRVYKEEIDNALGKFATILHADSPSEVMDKYIQIAKKHLL